MHDNGLISLYQTHDSREGFLNVKSLRLKAVSNPTIFSNTARCKCEYGYFFKKFNNYFSKEMADAEILLSQLSSKMGLTSAIYTPAQEDGKLFVLSNDIWTPNTVPAEAFEEYIYLKNGVDLREKFTFKDKQILNFFTKNGLKQKVKAQCFDASCNNPDRKETNYFYKINNENKADDVVLFDFERSGIESNCYFFGGRNLYCSNYFTAGILSIGQTRDEIIENFRTDESLNEVIDRHEMAQCLGNLNIAEVALDITRNIGYVIDPNYVDYIKSSFYNMAEALDK